MAKFPPPDLTLIARVEAVVRDAWERGNPVPGYRPEDWAKIATRAVRRWRSSARRGISPGAWEARVQDLAKGIAEALTGEHKRAEGLGPDWDALAEDIAAAIREYDSLA